VKSKVVAGVIGVVLLGLPGLAIAQNLPSGKPPQPRSETSNAPLAGIGLAIIVGAAALAPAAIKSGRGHQD